MAVRYYTDDCTYRLPQKRLTARWLHGVAESEGYTLGDVAYIFCSAQRLLEMNRQYRFPTLQEMRRVVVHGVLHLCGQGDKTPRSNAQMHRKEDKYLKFWENPEK